MAVPDPKIRSLETLLNHIVLPERLPSGQEGDTSGLETELADALIHATEALANAVPDPQLPTWDDVRGAILVAKELNNNSSADGLEKLSMLQHFRRLAAGELLILHVKEQNAGLLVRRPPRRVPPSPICTMRKADVDCTQATEPYRRI